MSTDTRSPGQVVWSSASKIEGHTQSLYSVTSIHFEQRHFL